MNNFYSILYLRPEPVSDEKISIGLFLNSHKKPVFDFSENKLKLASKLIGTDAKDSIERMLRNIKAKTDSASKNKNQTEAFNINSFSKDYFDYLKRYSNNLLIYSKPSENIGNFNLDDYNELFRLLIDKNFRVKKEAKESFKTAFKNKIKSSVINEKIDTFYSLSKDSLESVYRDHRVGYIGVNGRIITGNSIDLRGNPYNAENNLYLYRAMAEGLSNVASKRGITKEGKHIIYHNEPDSKKGNDLLSKAKSDRTTPLKFKYWGEFEEEEERIAASDSIRKFSDFISQ